MEISHSNATKPIHIGCLTGSVRSMATSKDFYDVFKAKFDLSELGLWYNQPRSEKYGEYNKAKHTLHIEIDRDDLTKRASIEIFFNTAKSNSTAFFGVPMILTPAFDYFAEDDVKASLENHSRKQISLGKSLRCTTISGVRVNNWATSDKSSTLLQSLMTVESITDKKIVGKSDKIFKGKLFYAIIPDRITNSVTFYYTRANYSEGRSVARGLPLFIRDFFRISPSFFCDSIFLSETHHGEWDFATRKFLSSDEKEENDRLNFMEDNANAEVQVYISKDQQIALAMDTDDISVETRLTKNDAAPPPTKSDEVSEMTGSTRESKAQRYATEQVKEVASQYVTQITTMSSDINEKDDQIAQLEIELRRMKNINDISTNDISPFVSPSLPPINNGDTISIHDEEEEIVPPSSNCEMIIQINDDDDNEDDSNSKDASVKMIMAEHHGDVEMYDEKELEGFLLQWSVRQLRELLLGMEQPVYGTKVKLVDRVLHNISIDDAKTLLNELKALNDEEIDVENKNSINNDYEVSEVNQKDRDEELDQDLSLSSSESSTLNYSTFAKNSGKKRPNNDDSNSLHSPKRNNFNERQNDKVRNSSAEAEEDLL